MTTGPFKKKVIFTMCILLCRDQSSWHCAVCSVWPMVFQKYWQHARSVGLLCLSNCPSRFANVWKLGHSKSDSATQNECKQREFANGYRQWGRLSWGFWTIAFSWRMCRDIETAGGMLWGVTNAFCRSCRTHIYKHRTPHRTFHQTLSLDFPIPVCSQNMVHCEQIWRGSMSIGLREPSLL